MFPSYLCFFVTLVCGHILYVYYTLFIVFAAGIVSPDSCLPLQFISRLPVSCLPHLFVSCFTVCHSYLLRTWCPVFKQTPWVYAFCSVIYFRGSYKTMDHSKVSPSCGNITHIWQSLWTTLYQIVILPVWYGIMFLLILYRFTVFFLCMHFCTFLQNFMYMWCRRMM